MLSWTSVLTPTGSTISKYILYNDDNIIEKNTMDEVEESEEEELKENTKKNIEEGKKNK